MMSVASGNRSNAVHPQAVQRARRDALLGPELTSLPKYRRAAVTSSPRNHPSVMYASQNRMQDLWRPWSGTPARSGSVQSLMLPTDFGLGAADQSLPQSMQFNENVTRQC